MKAKIFFIALFLYSTQVLAQSDSASIKPDTTIANKYFTQAKELYKKAQFDSSKYYFEKASTIYEKAAIIYENIISKINNQIIDGLA